MASHQSVLDQEHVLRSNKPLRTSETTDVDESESAEEIEMLMLRILPKSQTAKPYLSSASLTLT